MSLALCRHITAANVHTFLVIDRSSSMSSRGVVPDSRAIRGAGHSFDQLDNVLGVVYEAALRYMSERKQRAPTDLLTFVPFCGSAQVGFANRSVQNVDELLPCMMQCKPYNGTNFGNALDVAYGAVQRVSFGYLCDTSCHHLLRDKHVQGAHQQISACVFAFAIVHISVHSTCRTQSCHDDYDEHVAVICSGEL